MVRRNRSRSRLPEVDDPEDEEGDSDIGSNLNRDDQYRMRPSTSRYAIDEDVSVLISLYFIL